MTVRRGWTLNRRRMIVFHPRTRSDDKLPRMSIAQLKAQAAFLQPTEQRELIGFLIPLQAERDEDFRSTLTQKIDDSDPSHWVGLDELQKISSTDKLP